MNFLSYFPDDEPDPRTNYWILIHTPYIVLFCIFNYLFCILYWGPRYMKHRKAYDLKTFLYYYNIFQIIANTLFVFYTIKYGLFTDIPITCATIDRSTEGNPMQMTYLFWWVLILKLVDLLETVIFILRQKRNQISFLHVYHHITIVLFTWLVTKLSPGGMFTFHMAVNCSVHVIMYSYYLGSSIGPTMQKILSPIKKYITTIQMGQFIVLLIHISQGLFSNCNVPMWPVYCSVFNLPVNFLLFYHFYRSSYRKNNKAKRRTSDTHVKFY